MSNVQNNEALRGIVAAAICDLCAYITKLEAPIVVGGEYPILNTIGIFENYCFDRGIQLEPHAMEAWLNLCNQGALTTGVIAKPARRLKFKYDKDA